MSRQLLLAFAIPAYAVSWFLPALFLGGGLGSGGIVGWNAFLVALSAIGDRSTTMEWWLRFLYLASALTNAWFLFALASLTIRPMASDRVLFVGSLLACLLNTQWFLLGREGARLEIGYYLWVGSFAFLAFAVRRGPSRRMRSAALGALLLAAAAVAPARAAEGDFVVRDFRFRSGETLPELRVHYLTLGKAVRDARGEATNAVLILHGTGGSGRQFLAPQFANELYGAGAPLDTTRFFIVLADGIGHGRSSKPSDGLRMRFPRYGYDDMVAAQHRLLTEHLGVRHLRLVMGTSMGGMHTWVWGETYPDFMDALMPLACQPVAIVGRNRLWRSMLVDAIRNDPEWKNGDYQTQPRAGLRTAIDLLVLAGSAPIQMQKTLSSRDTVDRYLQSQLTTRTAALDANDLLYQVEASRDYDPAPGLERIKAPVLFVNSADDFINPPELGIAEHEIRRIKRGRFVLLPASEATRGHGSHTWAALWKAHLVELLRESKR